MFTSIAGTAVFNLTQHASYPLGPSAEGFLPHFEGPTNGMDNYGQRLRALLTAPMSGNYRFAIASDDASVLYLSPTPDPDQKTEIARVTGWTSVRQFNKEAGQVSAPIALSSGQVCYIEALMKEGGGGDNICVRWVRPDGVTNTPIPGAVLRPTGMAPPTFIHELPAEVVMMENERRVFVASVERPLNTGWMWQRNGAAVPGAVSESLEYGPVAWSNNGDQIRCIVTNWHGATTSRTAVVTVVPDAVPPEVAGVACRNPYRIEIVFSEPVEAASALNPTNYTVDGVSVTGVVQSQDQVSVLLMLSAAMSTGATVRISNVRDRASLPNTIVPNTPATVTSELGMTPLTLLRGTRESVGPSSRRTPLTITEIHYNPAPRADGRDTEFVEIFNSAEWPWDLGGHRLAGEISYLFPPGTIVSGRSYIVVAAAPADLEAAYGVGGGLGPYDGRLSNGGGTVILRGRLGETLLEAHYDDEPPWPAAPDGAGPSLILARPSYGERDARAWAAGSVSGGTPGGPDPGATHPWSGLFINEWLAHTDDPQEDFIEIYNAGTQAVSLAGCYLSDSPSTNKYVVPDGVVVPAGGFVSWTQSELGFALDASGEWIVLRVPDGVTVIDAVQFSASANVVALGRSPDGAPDWCELATPTAGLPNTPPLIRPVVINEIMYHPITEDSMDEYIELHNAGTTAADLGGWRVRGGISFNIPAGTTVPPGGYLVLATDANRLRERYAGLTSSNCLGNFSGSLSDRSDSVRLLMPEDLVSTNEAGEWVTNRVHVVVDEVSYWDGGPWGRWSDGGGSSLELTDARADNRRPDAWADSVETGACDWVTIEHTGVLDLGNSSYTASELHLIAMGEGEYDIDNVEVLNASGQNLLTNGTFETGVGGWTFRGTHEASRWAPTGGEGGSGGLRLIASARGDTGVNRAGAKLTATLPVGSVATLRARGRWRAGHPEVLLRLRGNWLEATAPLLTTTALGTPGRPNSRQGANAGAAIFDVRHLPATPAPGQPVEVWARVWDNDGTFLPRLRYRLDPSQEMFTVPMSPRRGGYHVAAIPGQPSNTMAAFHIEVEDAGKPSAVRRFPSDAPVREALIRWGETTIPGTFGHYRLWITEATRQRWASRDKNSNHPLDGTFVYNNDRVVYNIGCLYSGSPFHARNYNGPTGSTACDYVLRFPGDERCLGATDSVINSQLGGEDGTYVRQQICYWLTEQIGLPYLHRRFHHMFVNGSRRGRVCEDVQQPANDHVEEFFPNDDRGPLHKIEDWFEFQDNGVSFANVNATLGDFRTTGGERKTARYRWNWRPRAVRGTANNFTELFRLVDAVNATSPQPYEAVVPATIDLREWMRVLALERAVSNYDAYGFQRGKNMYAYMPSNGLWQLLIWDVDFSFGLGGAGQTTNALFGNENDLVIARMKNYPPFQRLFWAALKELVDGPFTVEKAEPQMLMRFEALAANNASNQHPASVANWLRDRRTFIQSKLADVASPWSVDLPAEFTTNANYLVLTGTAPVEVDRITVNGVGWAPEWLSLNQWRIYLPLAEGTNALRIHAVDVRGNPIAAPPVDRVVVTAAASEPAAGRVVINEIMYQPSAAGAAFVELHNASSATWYDLSRWRLEGVGLTIPDGTILPPGGFAVFAANRGAFAAAYGAGIPVAAEYPGGLADAGETLTLIRPGPTPDQGAVIDQVAYENRAPWPPVAAGQGASLQLIDPAADNRQPGNWSATLGSTSGAPAQVLVAMTNLWRYNAGGTNLGAAWMAVQADDAGWPAGRALLYHETANLPAPKITPLPLTNAVGDRIATYYFCTLFEWTGNASDVDLLASLIVDDGAVVYWNGVEALRVGVGRGPLAWTSLASRVVGDAVLEGPFALPSNLLLPGTNTVAVEVHQNSLNSSDIVFGMELAVESRMVQPWTPGATNSITRTLALMPDLWLNELVVSNVTGVADAAGEREPWIESHNAGTTTVSLAGWHLTDNTDDPLQWAFPPASTIPAGGFLVVWLDGEPEESTPAAPHTTFRIGGPTGVVMLVHAASNRIAVADHIRWNGVPPDRAFGSYPDGDPIARKLLRIPTPGAANDGTAPPLQLRINEWMADNAAAVADPWDGHFEDWFELYNPTDDPMDLGGATLTDDLSNTNKYRVPAGFTVPPRGFLLVWADNEPSQNSWAVRPDLHVGLALSKNGESIAVYDAEGRRVDAVAFGPQQTDVTEGRYPDGAEAIVRLPEPTPSQPNVAPATNHPPRLQTVPPTTVYRGGTVRLQLVTEDDDLPAQTLRFSMADAPYDATLDPETGLFEWTPSADGDAEAWRIQFFVTDSGEPPAQAAVEAFVVVLPLPRWVVAQGMPPQPGRPGGLRFETIIGRTYRIEYTDSLSPADWQPLMPAFEAVETAYEFVDDTIDRRRFHRVVDITP